MEYFNSANGSTTAFSYREGGTTTLQAWKQADGGKSVTLTISSAVCNFTATAITSG